MGAFSLRIIIYIIDLITRGRSRLATELPCLCFTSKTVSFLQVFRMPSCYFVWIRRNQSFNIALKTTDIEDTYQILTFPFTVGVNNSSKTFAITKIRDKINRVSVPQSSIPQLQIITVWSVSFMVETNLNCYLMTTLCNPCYNKLSLYKTWRISHHQWVINM